MRILHMLNHTQNIGNGIVNVAVDLACLQSQAGHVVAIASAKPKAEKIHVQNPAINNTEDYKKLLTDCGVQYFMLEQHRTLANLLRVVGRYRRIIQDFQPNIVHVHMMTGVVLARALRLGSSYRLVSTVHNEFQRSARLMGLADRVIAVSHAVAAAMQKQGIPQQKLKAIQNATIGSPRQKPLTNYEPLPLKRPAITTVAGLYPRKGISDLIEGFNQVATQIVTAHLYIVGNGPSREQFERQAAASPFSERIHFEGFQPEPQRYLRSTDVFVLASRQEPFGLVISEAREAGCAIVATRVGGIPEALDEKSTKKSAEGSVGELAGLLVAPGDSSSIAAALVKLLANSNCLNHWQQKAQKNLENLHVERMHQETLALYEQMINTP